MPDPTARSPRSTSEWRAPSGRCGRVRVAFANRNQSHTCGTVDLDEHLRGKPPDVIAMFERFRALVEARGSVTVLPEKTRIAFHVRMSFAAVTLHQDHMNGHLILARRLESPRFTRIETYSPRNHLHAFRFTSPDEIDDEVAGWIDESYAVGEQKHLL
ncbi:MAG: DUF5655 domain-containing protein [Actinomycetota bacterium]